MKTEGILEFEECISWLMGLPYKTKGDWMQGDIQGSGRCSVVEEVIVYTCETT